MLVGLSVFWRGRLGIICAFFAFSGRVRGSARGRRGVCIGRGAEAIARSASGHIRESICEAPGARRSFGVVLGRGSERDGGIFPGVPYFLCAATAPGVCVRSELVDGSMNQRYICIHG